MHVTVDNFVEIGDFFALYHSFYTKYGRKAVEKSINELKFMKKSTELVNEHFPAKFDGTYFSMVY